MMTIYKKIDAHNVAVLEVMTPMPKIPKIRLISRIQVPTECRGNGVGTYLLGSICSIADDSNYTLYFHIPEKRYIHRTVRWLIKYQFFLASNPDLLVRLPGPQDETIQIPTVEEIIDVRRYLEEGDVD